MGIIGQNIVEDSRVEGVRQYLEKQKPLFSDNHATFLLLQGGAIRLTRAVAGVCAVLSLDGLWGGLFASSLPNARLWGALAAVFLLILPVWKDKFFARKSVNRWVSYVDSVLSSLVIVSVMQMIAIASGVHFIDFSMSIILWFFLIAWRLLIEAVLTPLINKCSVKSKVLIFGAGKHGVDLAETLIKGKEVDVLGFLDERQSRIDATSLPVPLLGTLQNPSVPLDKIDSIIITLPNTARDRFLHIMSSMQGRPMNVYVSPDIPAKNKNMLFSVNRSLDNLALIGVDKIPAEGQLIKRIFDIIFSLIVIFLFIPFGLVIAGLIKIDSPGPVFFRQKRYGMGNNLFYIYKFRSMAKNSNSEDKIKLTTRSDARVRPLGHFLRSTSLDEMPQFLNVLLGDMSVVGPRPHPPGVQAGEREYEKIIEEFSQRYKVKPGITGWAQVNGARGSTFTEESLIERFEYDVEYINNWSFGLDILIVIRTVLGGFFGKNAY